ncbi:MAG: hypothetical protein EON54_03410 [Alcaligenaceae bacterium]|nr:MAG: hypothetical protein EON54_03410 [Alcaligenaceae bacterium]
MNQHDKEALDLAPEHKKEAKRKFDNGLWRYAKINRISLEEAQADYDYAKSEVDKLSSLKFSLELSLIKEPSFDCHSNKFEDFLIMFADKD